ncbi:MAG TPA: hypothetical protein PLS49_01090, partial [Candidatus Woesebacteria bacterium]|nr:hypothetical protein [Candidatus Woesebacteria bacterium]
DFHPTEFELTREPEDTEVVGSFVRGATPPEGIICDTRYWYGEDYKIKDEDASFDFHWNFAFTELMLRRRKVQFIPRNMNELALETYDRHLAKSKLFKPKVAIGIDRGELHRKILYDYDTSKKSSRINPKTVHSQLQVVSDGRKAYVKPLSLIYGDDEG